MGYPTNNGLWFDSPAKKGTKGPTIMPTIPSDIQWTPARELPRLDNAKQLQIDIETYDPDLIEKGPGVRRGGLIIGLAVATEDRSWYFPIKQDLPWQYDPNGYNWDADLIMRWAKRELCRPGIPKIGANLLYDLEYLWYHGVEVPGPYYDIQIAEPLIDENSFSYSLGNIAKKYMGEGKTDERLYNWLASAYGGKPTRRDQAKNIYRAPPELVGEYALSDVELPRDILAKQQQIIQQQELGRVWDIETRLLPMMLAMRLRGVAVDLPRTRTFGSELEERAAGMQKNLDNFGVEPNKAATIAAYCEKKKIQFLKTEQGNPSFPGDWLEAHDDEILRQIAELRQLEKLKGTFINGAILGNQINGRIHTQFNQLRSDEYGTVSGRFSSSNPNLQNIPVRTELGSLMRELFIPDDGEIWFSDDWSQIEFRMLVHYAFQEYGRRDPNSPAAKTRQAFLDDASTDFHQVVADLTGIDRKPAKNINFGLVYGMGEPTMARNMGKPLEAVKPMFEQYHSMLPFIKQLYWEADKRAKRNRYIKTYLGRRRRWDKYFESTDWDTARRDGSMSEREAQEKYNNAYKPANTNKALNALLQGSAADVMKIAMVDIWEAGICDVLGAPLLTVHDELNWSVPDTKEGLEAHAEAKHIMENCVTLNLPLLCDSDSGANWGQAH